MKFYTIMFLLLLLCLGGLLLLAGSGGDSVNLTKPQQVKKQEVPNDPYKSFKIP